jgi:2-polyprenyl-6-methoxyphenol hydroxylase-like FAD-dependent oxidoreductase
VGDLISATPSIYKAVLHDLKPMPKWSKNNTILLGDAGHATTPNMGQGACQGIEDAYSFANHLNKHKGLKSCFEQFEKQRRQKVDYVVNTSWKIGKMAHHPITQLMLKSMMKMTPQWVLKKQMRSLYSVEEL